MSDFEFDYKWWRSRVKLSHSLVTRIIASQDITDTLLSGGGAVVVASGVLAAPIIAIIAAYIKLELLLIKRLDQGNGVYLYSYGVMPGLLWIPQSA
jgi:hypothetical protein